MQPPTLTDYSDFLKLQFGIVQFALLDLKFRMFSIGRDTSFLVR